MSRNKRIILGFMAIESLFMGILPQTTRACGPNYPYLVFSYASHPDLPLEQFASGRLGIVQTTWARSYLLAAYRNLDGKALSIEERKGMMRVWRERANWMDSGKINLDPDHAAMLRWMKIRGSVIDRPPAQSPVRMEKTKWGDSIEITCEETAFNLAVDTLRSRIKVHGAHNVWVHDWIMGQDEVFSACAGNIGIPGHPPPTAPVWLVQDRAYQGAAALYHAEGEDAALPAFRTIAADRASPWRPLANYLVLRCRRGKLDLYPKESDPVIRAEMGQIGKAAESLRSDPEMKPAYPAIETLIAYVQLRLNPANLAKRLAVAFRAGKPLTSPQEDFLLLIYALDRLEEESRDFSTFDAARREANVPAVRTEFRRADELIDWISTMQSRKAGDYPHALARWRAGRKTAWMIAALWKIPGNDPAGEALISAAGLVRPDNPAFLTARFLSARWLAASGRSGDASEIVIGVLDQEDGEMPPSARNLFLGMKMRLARNPQEFVSSVVRVPAGVAAEDDMESTPPNQPGEDNDGQPAYFRAVAGKKNHHFDLDGALQLNSIFTAEELLALSNDNSFQTHLRKELAVVSWTRAVLLDNHALGVRAAPILMELAPELRETLQLYLNASSIEERRFVAVLTLLRFPGLHPYAFPGFGRVSPLKLNVDLERNGWCRHNPSRELSLRTLDEEYALLQLRMGTLVAPKTPASFYSLSPGLAPPFRSPEQIAASQSELKALSQVEGFENYLARRAQAWTLAHPDDPRNAEALLWSLRATSNLNTCYTDETDRLSKANYKLLMTRYGNSDWAKKSRRWY